jgi:hypothetical protein
MEEPPKPKRELFFGGKIRSEKIRDDTNDYLRRTRELWSSSRSIQRHDK